MATTCKTDEELEARWQRGLAARRANAEQAHQLICDIGELEGGRALQECTRQRYEIRAWVWALPQYNHAAREKLLRETE